MQVSETIKSVDELLENLTSSLSPEIIGWIKQRFETILQNLTGLNFTDVRVDFVVDTNSIISSLLRYAQGRGSILFHMINNPIFKFHAPVTIENEIKKFILTHRKKIYQRKIVEGWNRIKALLKIGTEISINALTISKGIIGKRDPKDVPFVAMYLDLGAKNIITRDKDFEHFMLRPLQIQNVGQIVVGVYKGLLSFVVLGEVTPATISFLGQSIVAIVRILFDIVKTIIDFTSAMARSAVDKATISLANLFPQIRDWVDSGAININVALLIIALSVGGAVSIAAISNNKIRDDLVRLSNYVKELLHPFIDGFMNWLGRSIKLLGEYLKVLMPHMIGVIILLITNISSVVSNVKFTA